jgi:hypothetical protein
MEKIWLKSYPAGVPAEIDPTRYDTVASMLEESMKKYAARTAFICMGKSITYGETRRRLAQAWRLAAVARHRTRRPRCHHDAEHHAVPGGRGGGVARRLRGGERQPAVHAARTRAPAQGQRRPGHHHHRELRHHAGEGDRQHAGQACGGRGHGRPARRPQGHAGESRGAQGQEDGARVFAAGLLPLQRRGVAGRAA